MHICISIYTCIHIHVATADVRPASSRASVGGFSSGQPECEMSVCVLCGSPVWPSPPVVGPLWGPPLCVGPLCGSPVWVPRRAASMWHLLA